MKKEFKLLFSGLFLATVFSLTVFAQDHLEPPGFEGGGGTCVVLRTNDATCRSGSIVPKCGFVISGPQAKDCNWSAST